MGVRLRSGVIFQDTAVESCYRLRTGYINFQKQWLIKLTWLALDEDQAARSRTVEQLIAL